jgi:myo-inositol-1(or 4)-monophosphatase
MGGAVLPSDVLNVAIRAAQAGGRVLMSRLGTLKESEIRKKGKSDWVTAADHASERAIVQTIRRSYPGHSIRAEESGLSAEQSPFQWIIDPLDGTVNYLHRFPMFAVSIAVARAGVLRAGVVLDPVRKELFAAERGRGAWLNGKRIHVSPNKRMEDAMLATGFPFRSTKQMEVYLDSFRAAFAITGSVRRAGSAALDLAYTACGRLDGFWEMSLSSWDIAAGALLIQEAGGVVSDFFGGDGYLETGNILAGSPQLQKALLKTMAPIFRGRI